MTRIKKLSLVELFCFINDNIPIHVNSIDGEAYLCDVEIKADYVTINKTPTVTIINLGVKNLITAEVDKHTATIRTDSYKEIIISW